jgi:hypothetical protein
MTGQPVMKRFIAAAGLVLVSIPAFAQQPAPTSAGSARIYTEMPEGHVTAMIIAVGGFLGIGEKDVAVPFASIRASEKNDKWYLVLNTTKDTLKAAPGFTYDKTKTAWIPAAKWTNALLACRGK